MEINQQTFIYRYSAKENSEVQEIRKKYLPQSETPLDELKRLDEKVQNAGTMESLCVGLGGLMVLGLGMCFSLQVLGTGVMVMMFGILLGLVGTVGMLMAYPVKRYFYKKNKERFVSRILELTEVLSKEF